MRTATGDPAAQYGTVHEVDWKRVVAGLAADPEALLAFWAVRDLGGYAKLVEMFPLREGRHVGRKPQ